MNSLTLLNTALVFHLCGLALIAGSTVMDYIGTSIFWKRYATNKAEARTLRDASRFFPVVSRIGIALLILSGLAMMAIMHGVYGQQTWMRIKIALVVLIIANILVIGRRNDRRLIKSLDQAGNNAELTPDLLKVKGAIKWFHSSQLFLFLVIIVLSAFKFN